MPQIQSHHPFLVLLALPLIFMELLWLRHKRPARGYDWDETRTSVLIMAGQWLLHGLNAVIALPVLLWVQSHALFSFSMKTPWSFLALFIGTEFFYYCFHRCSHSVRWLWASHAVHHSSTRLNFSAALRLGWTGGVSGGWLFLAPLVWLGFPLTAVLAAMAANLAYQFLVHTETVPCLGPLEWGLNTPAHHRVHHACNPELLDRNFGGVTIVFDRLFGTFAAATPGRELRYGTPGAGPDRGILSIVLGEWRRMLHDARRARQGREIWRALFGRP